MQKKTNLAVALFSGVVIQSAMNAATNEMVTVELEEMVIKERYLSIDVANALKTPTPIIDVPQSLSIVGEEQIDLQGFTSIGDIIDYTPGVTNSQGEGHRDAVIFRGVRSTADFYIDGVRDDVQYYRPLYNVEQVEVLRGPNALLFGRGGTGGILNRVMKKPQIGESFTAYKASVDTFGAYLFELDSNFGEQENVAARFNLFYEELNNDRDFFDGERIGFNPTVRFQLQPETTLDLSYEFIDHDRFIDRGIPTGADGRPVEEFEDIVFADPDLNFSKLDAHLVKANVQHKFSQNLKGNFTAFYGYYDKIYANVYPSAYDQINTPDRVTLDGYVDANVRENAIFSGNLIGEIETGPLVHTLITGAEFIHTSSDQDRFNTFWSTNQDDTEEFLITRPLNLNNGVGVNADGQVVTNDFTADLNDDTRVTLNVYSFYLQDEIAVSEKLDIVLGGRFDRFDIEVFNVPANETRTRVDEEFSPRAGIIFKPRKNLSLYTSYSKSFLPRSGEQFTDINGSNNQLDPNTYTNLELGVKWDIFKNLSLTLSAFEIEESSPQVADNDPSTLDVIDSEITGFEAQIMGEITDRWFVSAGYTYLDGEQVNRSGSTGLRLRELPEHAFSVWNGYRLTDKFGLGLGVIYQDESFANNSNTATLPSYTRLDALAYYDISENLRIQLNVENLTDELYFPYSHSANEISVGAPLSARLTISGRF